MINIKENEKLNILNHSCAHLLAQAVKHLYPNAKFWVGPVIEDGFYYDIDLGDETLTDEDLPKIEKEMKKISKDNKLIKDIYYIKNDLAEELFSNTKDKVYIDQKIDLNKISNQLSTLNPVNVHLANPIYIKTIEALSDK